MKSLDDAIQILIAQARRCDRLAVEGVPLGSAFGRVLAEDITSLIDVPAYDNSQMDGYVGIAVEMNNALEPMEVSQRIPAGHPGEPLRSGTVARIFTGAPIPSGANAVVMQEEVVLTSDGRVRLTTPIAPGHNVRVRAGDLAKGQTILTKGRRLSAADVALCASVGVEILRVVKPPTVGVFSSGDELRQPGEPLDFGQIYDSNRPMILGLAKALGCQVRDMGCLPDTREATTAGLAEASRLCDVILTCGGVSVGEEDHIKAAISDLGSLDLWKIAVKPGKPFAFGAIGGATLMGMPGNPVAAWLTFGLLVRPYLLARMDAEIVPLRGVRAVAGFDWISPDSRREFLRGWLDEEGVVQIHGRQNSAVLSSVTQSGGLVDLAASTPIHRGEFIRFIPYTEFLS